MIAKSNCKEFFRCLAWQDPKATSKFCCCCKTDEGKSWQFSTRTDIFDIFGTTFSRVLANHQEVKNSSLTLTSSGRKWVKQHISMSFKKFLPFYLGFSVRFVFLIDRITTPPFPHPNLINSQCSEHDAGKTKCQWTNPPRRWVHNLKSRNPRATEEITFPFPPPNILDVHGHDSTATRLK